MRIIQLTIRIRATVVTWRMLAVLHFNSLQSEHASSLMLKDLSDEQESCNQQLAIPADDQHHEPLLVSGAQRKPGAQRRLQFSFDIAEGPQRAAGLKCLPNKLVMEPQTMRNMLCFRKAILDLMPSGTDLQGLGRQ